MTNTTTLHLSFGPVQEFIAQARRTRDLWAGSYLLSWLAAHALAATTSADGTPVIPNLDDNDLFAAVKSNQQSISPSGARVGSVPHVAQITVPEAAAPAIAQAATRAWIAAWERVARAVLGYLHPQLAWTDATTAIWDRQVASAWTTAWAIGDPAALAQRKTFRAFDLPAEPGEKCICCGQREPLHSGNASRGGVNTFWTHAAQRARYPADFAHGQSVDRLCAVCAIKRFLPYVGPQALGWEIDRAFPSTVTMATLTWRLGVLQAGTEQPDLRLAVRSFVLAVQQADREAATYRDLRGVGGIEEVIGGWGDEREAARAFSDIEANWLSLERGPTHAKTSGVPAEAYAPVAAALRRLRSVARDRGIPAPSAAYALLVMDGDRMGQILHENSTRTSEISAALGAFSRDVPAIVEASPAHGRLIYAGGDDVLALLPAETALATARRLRDAYRARFSQDLAGPTEPSISAAIVFAHEMTPLQSVVHKGHRLLEEEAKGKAGRNAFAVAVWQRGGVATQFAAPWGEGDEDAITRIDALRAAIAAGHFSRGFLYGLQDQFALTRGAGIDRDVERQLLAVAYRRGQGRAPAVGNADDDSTSERITMIQQLPAGSDNTGGTPWNAVRLALALTGEDA